VPACALFSVLEWACAAAGMICNKFGGKAAWHICCRKPARLARKLLDQDKERRLKAASTAPESEVTGGRRRIAYRMLCAGSGFARTLPPAMEACAAIGAHTARIYGVADPEYKWCHVAWKVRLFAHTGLPPFRTRIKSATPPPSSTR
jgi:hypothetical protein